MAQDSSNRIASEPTTAKSFVEIAIERGYCTQEQLNRLRRASGSNSQDFAQRLIDAGVITEQQARACERAMRGQQVIAGFEILEKVGQGGMGAVFRARQISMDRIIALKILPPKLAQDPLFKTRFLNEARVSAKLSHMNIINGIDCGEAAGYTYFAMEYVDGRTIKQIMKEKGKFSPEGALKIIRQMVEALAYAKSQGLVHRDVKPDNIMLTAAGVAKLCDLGLAKQIQGNDDANLTQSGQAVGTPHYISPEQARGEQVDFTSDIYSLGATFYHMLTGQTPFNAPTSAAVMALHIANDTKNPCDVDGSIPLGYGQVISKMMAKAQSDRYTQPPTLLEEMDALEAGDTPKAASFKAKSSCLMPQASPNRNLRGRTTGPQQPIGRTTGPQQPVGRATGPQTAVDDRPRRTTTKTNQPPWVAIGAMVALVVVVLLVMMNQGGNSGTNVADAKKDKPSQPPAQPEKPMAAAEPRPQPSQPPPLQPQPQPNRPQPPEKPKDVVGFERPQPRPMERPERPEPQPVQPPPETSRPEPVKQPEPAIAPNPPAPSGKSALTNDSLHARFLAELIKKTSNSDLSKQVNGGLKPLLENPAYKPIHKEIDADVTMLRSALEFEQKAIAAIGAAGGEIEVTAEKGSPLAGFVQKNTKVKIDKYDPNRGIEVQVPNGPIVPISALNIAPDQIYGHSPDKSPAAQLPYRLARGDKDGFKQQLGALQKDKDKWEQLLSLWNDGEKDLQAQTEFEALGKIADAKDWKKYEPAAADFDKNFGTSAFARENAAKLAEWKSACDNVLHPQNPWKKVFHASVNRLREDGFLELEYDFASVDQLQDFSAAKGVPKLMGGRVLYIEGADPQGDRLVFNGAMADLRSVSVTSRVTKIPGAGFRFGIIREGQSLSSKMGVFLGLDNGGARLYTDPFDSSQYNDTALDDLQPIGDQLEVAGQSRDGNRFNWTINGKAIGGAQAPSGLRNGRLALNCFRQAHNLWTSFKIVFRPDLNLLANNAADFANAQNRLLMNQGANARGGSNPGWLIDGDSARAGCAELRGNDYFLIGVPQATPLNCIRVQLNEDDPSRTYSFKLEVSGDDGTNFTTVADKDDVRGWQTIRFESRPVRFIKLSGSASAGNFQCREVQGFNLPKQP